MTHCPRCGGRSLYRELGDICCLACGTLRAEPNPDALLDKLRGNRPSWPGGQPLTRNQEHQMRLAL